MKFILDFIKLRKCEECGKIFNFWEGFGSTFILRREYCSRGCFYEASNRDIEKKLNKNKLKI